MKYLVIDNGGTFIKYALMKENAEILEKSKIKTPNYKSCNLEDYINVIVNVFEKYANSIDGIAMSVPGMVDSDTGYCYTGGSLSYISKTNLAEILQERCKVPVTIENDGKCAALAENWIGSLKNVKNGAVFIIGTAIGGGIIVNKKLYKGNNFAAGEFSYMAVDSKNTEAEDSYLGLIGGFPHLAALVSEKTNISVDELDGYKVFEMANNNDTAVLNSIDEYTKILAVQIYNIQSLLDLDLIAIGGGISEQPILIEYIQKNIDYIVDKNPLKKVAQIIPKPRITNCKFYNDSNLIGALYNYINKREYRNS